MTESIADKNRRILVIDDNRAIHEDFRKILSPGNAAAALDAAETELFGQPANQGCQIHYEIDSACQGHDGVLLVQQALAAGRPYAMAFVDIRMPPGMDGVETTQKIREVDPEIQIVLCTAYADYSWDEIFQKIGNSDGLVILKKPFDTVEVLQLAQAFTEKWWLHQQSREKMEELERRIAARTGELEQANRTLQNEVIEHQRAEALLRESEKKFRSVFEGANDGLFILKEGVFVDVNKRGEEMVGWPREELIGAKPDKISPPVQPDGHLSGEKAAEHDRAALAGTPQFFEWRLQRRDGTQFDGEVSVKRFEFGNEWYLQSTVRDITERKQAEEAVRESEERFSGAFEHAPIGVALVSPEGRWLRVNRALCDLVGYSEAELFTRTFQDITCPGDLDADLENMRQMLAGEIGSYQMEKRYIHARGHLITVLLNVSLVRDGLCLPRYFISQIQDITARKQADHALLESNEKFRQLADNITDVFWIRSPDLSELHYVSPAFEQIWGRSVASLHAGPHRWIDFILAEDRERVESAFTTLKGDVRSLEIEYRIVRPDGEIRWVRVRGFQVRDAADRLIRHAGIVTDITQVKLAENLVVQSEARYRSLIDNARDAIFTIAADGTFTSLNPATESIAGISRADWLGKPFAPMVHPEDLPLATEMFQRTLKGEPSAVHELRGHPRLPRPALMEMTLTTQQDENGTIIGVLGIGRNITDRKRLEAQLFQSQKLETVGKLAGGIAHEFNSILTAIIGQSELLLGDLPADSPLGVNASEIIKAANRAATLTRQLLAYGRKQFLRPEALSLNQVIASMDGVLRHLMGGKAVAVNFAPAANLQLVKADAGQIEQVIMNLALNARDAMPNGGKLTLETANVSLDEAYLGQFPDVDLKAGDYVMLAVSDTGTGMSPEVKARAFEPFFSTKGVGQGTGLGLSTCYGIVKQSGGHISVYSEVGRGTTFKIYLPQVASPAELPLLRIDSPDLPRGTETILLVEDDPALREMAATLLRRLGYTVFAAANGVEALSLKNDRTTGHIDLLFTDVVMPHMSGKELADRVRALYPQTKILFTSAYTENAIVHQGVLHKGVALLQKPFTPSALARKMRAVLDQPGVLKPDAMQGSFGFPKTTNGEAAAH